MYMYMYMYMYMCIGGLEAEFAHTRAGSGAQ